MGRSVPMTDWQVHAVKYADRNARVRGDSFLFDDRHDVAHPMDYFIWVLRRGDPCRYRL